MGGVNSVDESKRELELENERLRAELARLKSNSDGVDSGIDSGIDSGVDSGEEKNYSESDQFTVSDEDNLSVDELIMKGLRLQPLFNDQGECVEIVASVVDDINSNGANEDPQGETEDAKKKKKSRKPKKPEIKRTKKKQLKKNKKHRLSSKRRRPIITAQLEPDALMHAVDTEENEDLLEEARSLKKKVLENAQTHNSSIRCISDPSTIENLLEEELQKGEHSAFYFVNLGAVVEKWLQWSKLFPRIEPFYAMKSNPDINIVKTLHFLGTGFDCASKAELDEAISVGVPPEKIIFANPCKGKEHILFAKQIGVEMMTFDNVDELEKVYSLYPNAKLVIRILPNDSHSLMPFGTKFGASLKESVKLIAHCKKLGASLIGVSFHVGSGCFSSLAWIEAIGLARQVFDEAIKEGFDMNLLDIGGGWPGTDAGPLLIEDINEAICRHIESLFPPSVRVIAEPGRFFCTSCYTLAVTVTSRRERYRAQAPKNVNTTLLHRQQEEKEKEKNDETKEEKREEEDPLAKEVLYYLSDGVYGSFNNIVFDHARPSPATFKKSDETRKSCLFGPTCDSIDVIARDIQLPELKMGDWVYFPDMGAYTMAAASTFNGFATPPIYYFSSV
jgi:ornithine decarboxylase